MDRIPFDEYLFNIVKEVAKRSTCLRRQVGAVIVKDKQIISTGYNGAPSGCVHCLDIGCIREKLGIKSGERYDICRAGHAEFNAIAQAAKHGIATKGSIIWTQWIPCSYCAKAIINSGIISVHVIYNDVLDPLGRDLLEEAHVSVEVLHK